MRPFLPRLGLLLLTCGTLAHAQTATPACTGLCLQQVTCPTGSSTTISGKVYAPNGTDPIPNVTVYVPNAAVAPMSTGVSCPVPGQLPSGSPLIGTFSAVDGSFTLTNAPVGANIPLVIVAGKWRRQVVVPATVACANTTMDVRFPKNQTEGDIPRFAVSTGSADQVECVLRKVGIDDTEFTDPTGTGRIQLYTSTLAPGAQVDAATPTANTLMGDLNNLSSYDVLMLPCEGAAHTEPAGQLANLVSYTNTGGRLYASHYAYEWLWHNPPFDTVANWTGSTGSLSSGTATVNQTTAAGVTLAQWLLLVQASATLGQIDLSTIKFDISGINPPTVAALNLNTAGNPVMQFTFATPVGVPSGQCGRVLFNEYHVESNGNSRGKLFPAECSTASITPQEKLLEYSLFDLSNNGGPATISPLSADFGNQVVGYPSAAQTFTIKNNSVFAATLTSIATTDDFLVTANTCDNVGATASCTVSVVFKPTTLGPHTGALNLVLGGTTLTAALTGTGIPSLNFITGTLDFGSTDVGTTVTRTLTLTNSAPGPVALPAFTLTGDYTASSNCPAAIPGGASCALTLSFVPTVYGTRPGTLSAGGSASNLMESMTGDGLDFSMTVAPTSANVVAGLSTTPLVTATPLGGFTAPVTFTCTTTTPGMACTVTTPTVPLTAATSFNITVSTTSQYTLAGYGLTATANGNSTNTGSRLLVLLSAAGAFTLLLARRRLGSAAPTLFLLLLLVATTALTGCSGKIPSLNPVYTPPGTYTVVLSATDGTLVRTANYSLKVSAR